MHLFYLKFILKKILPKPVIVRLRNFLFKLTKNSLPTKVRIEASTLCQLNCKSCYMRKSNSGTMGNGFLKFIDFKRFIQCNPFVREIELSNSGEIFLDPDLIHILECAFENDIALYADNGVNFNTASDEIIEALVKYQFRHITFSIDGASQEIYSLYRINGNFNNVIKNITKLNSYKKKYNSEIPELKWQYIIMEHNENDVIKAKEMAKELNMEIAFKLTWDDDYIPKNREMLIKETGLKFLTRKEMFESEKKLYNYEMCLQLWKSPQINYDGRLLGCCSVYTDDFGVNVFEIGLKRAINSKNYKYAKKMLEGKADIPENKENIPCVNCGIYKKMKETGLYI